MVGASAVALGACLAAFYLLPAIYEQRWVNIGGAVIAGSRPQDSFLFMHTTDVDHDNFNRLVSWVAIAEIITALAAAGAARLWRTKYRDLWSALTVWAGACSVLMFSITGLLWRVLPKLRFVQFPWRLAAVSELVSLASGRAERVALVGATCGLPGDVAGAGRCWAARIKCHGGTTPPISAKCRTTWRTGTGYEGMDEYTPLGADASTLSRTRATSELTGRHTQRFAFPLERRVEDVNGGNVGAGPTCSEAI